MKRVKSVLFYGKWAAFWVGLFALVLFLFVETRGALLRVAPLIVVGVVVYAFYAMLKTKPALPTEEKESPTSDTKSDADEQSK